MSSGLDTVTEQLTNSILTQYVIDGLLLERDYTIAVRGYYQLLGPADTTIVRLEGKILQIISFIHCLLFTGLHVCILHGLSCF